MNTTTDVLAAARAAALFVSSVSGTGHPTAVEVDDAIRHSLRTRGGSRGCAADLAAAYGDHPELAARRMRWALAVVAHRYTRPAARRHAAAGQTDRQPTSGGRHLVHAA